MLGDSVVDGAEQADSEAEERRATDTKNSEVQQEEEQEEEETEGRNLEEVVEEGGAGEGVVNATEEQTVMNRLPKLDMKKVEIVQGQDEMDADEADDGALQSGGEGDGAFMEVAVEVVEDVEDVGAASVADGVAVEADVVEVVEEVDDEVN